MHVLFLSYHLPMSSEPGAFRPWMEARLLRRAGFSVTVITSGVQYMTGEDIRPYRSWCTEEEIEGVRILRTWAPRDYRRSLARRMGNYLSYVALAAVAALVRAGRVERVFAGTDPVFMTPMTWLVSLVKRAPLVLDERDLFPETAIALGVAREGVLTRLVFRMQQGLRRHAQHILTATPGIRRRLLAYGHPAGKVETLYNADAFLYEDCGGADPAPDTLRALTGRTFLVGYAGGLGRANDLPTLLDAARRLQGEREIGFVIIGSGERLAEYQAFCAEHGLDNVRFIPAVPRTEARRLLAELDLCVHLYPDDELFEGALGSKTFDYHGLGKPMIFCGRGDVAALLDETGGGVALPPGDGAGLARTIVALRDDEPRRTAMGESARRWFRANVEADAMAALLRRAMRGG